jgi:hypothetical protein
VFFLLNVCREGNGYTDLVQKQFAEKFPPDFYLWGAAKSAVYRARPRTLNELKTAVIVYIRNISQADLQKVFANKIKLDAILAVLFISNYKITLHVSDAFCAHHQEY